MTQKISNNARAKLTAGIIAGDTSIAIEVAKADSFPVADTGAAAIPQPGKDWFKAVLQDDLGNIEIIYVRSRGAGVAILSNVIRAQEGTAAQAFAAGSVVGLRLTALDHENAIALSADATAAGKALLNGADASAQMTSLGFTAYFKTLLAAVDAAAMRLLLGAAAAGANADITSMTGLTAGGLPDNSVLTADIANAQITAAKLDGGQTGSAPVFGVRAWVNFNGTDTVAIRASGNVSSITDNGVGDYSVNFTTAMPNANYAAFGLCNAVRVLTLQSQTTAAVRINAIFQVDTGAENADVSIVHVAVVG